MHPRSGYQPDGFDGLFQPAYAGSDLNRLKSLLAAPARIQGTRIAVLQGSDGDGAPEDHVSPVPTKNS